MEAELLQQVAHEWLGRPLAEAEKTARRLSGLLAELRSAERSGEEPAFRFDPGRAAGGSGSGWGPGTGQADGQSPGRAHDQAPEQSPSQALGQPQGSPSPVGLSSWPGAPAATPLDLPTPELLRLIQTGKLSAVALTQAALDRITERDAAVNAFVARLPDRALAQAAALDAAIQRGEAVGPLAGLPVGLKDLIDLTGVPTTACSPMRATAVAQTDAAVATRLLQAGAIILGKTATHEWAYGTTCTSSLHGTTRNPVALAHSPGGSSGGSAAAVAAGMLAGALGTDTAGSLRIPAACCGVVGFKPTFGRVSRAGILPLSHSLDHAGPIGRSVTAVALLFEAIADGSRTSAPTSLSGLRIGLPEAWLSGPLDPAVAASFQAALDRLRERGVALRPVELPSLDLAHFISRILTLAEGAAVHAGNLDRLNEYPPDVRARLELGQFILARDYLLAQQLRSRYCREMANAMAGLDLILTPTQPIPAPRLEQRIWTYPSGAQEALPDALTRFVAPANVTGQPALSLPCGRTPEGLPVGLQLMGHPDGDAALLGIATLIEAALGG